MSEQAVRLDAESRTAVSTWCPLWPFGFRVVAEDAALLGWIRAHLSYTLCVGELPPDEPDVVVRISLEPRLLSAVDRLLKAGPTRIVEGFPGQFWRTGVSEGRTAWNRVDPVNGKVSVVRNSAAGDEWLVCAESGPSAALTALRVCRELHRMRLSVRDAVLVHSSLVVANGLGGLLFVGPKGAGKTTLALSVAQRMGYAVSTDLTYLLADSSPVPIGVGLPDTNRIAAGTLSGLTAYSGTPPVPLLRDKFTGLDGNPPPVKSWMTILETEVLHRVSSAPAARVDGVVVVDAQHGRTRPLAEPIPTAVIESHLRSEFRPHDHSVANYWLTPDCTPPRARAEDLLRIARALPAVRLVWSPGGHGIQHVVAALRQGFTQRRPSAAPTNTEAPAHESTPGDERC